MRILLTTLLFLSSTIVFAQDTIPEPPPKPEKERNPFKERLFFSPDLGLQFGNVTYINVSPKVGYMLTEKLGAGVGGTYIYINDQRYKSIGYTYESSIYGGSLFAQYQLVEFLQLYSEYQLLNLDAYDARNDKIYRKNVPALLVGGAYTQRMGANSSVGLMVLWDIIEDRDSFYSNPILRIGFNFGL